MVSTPKKPLYRSLEAWEALKQRDLECAVNLLVAGEWIVDGVVKDDYSCERCQETAPLVLIVRREILKYLEDHSMTQQFKKVIQIYRLQHVGDKSWNQIFTMEDICIENDCAYESIKRVIIEYMGSDWTTFLGHAHTLACFSVLSTTECGIPIRYRRSGDILVETTEAQRNAGVGEHHDAEFPMRTDFTGVSFRLIDKLSPKVLPAGISEMQFGERPRRCQTAAEQAREIFHFSKATKRPGCHDHYPITIGSFSDFMQILLRLCWIYGISVTVCMPRLRHDGPLSVCNGNFGLDEPITYELTFAPVITYISTNDNGGSFRMVDPQEAGIEDEPCWKLLGYSMYHKSQPGKFLTSPCDDEFTEALKQTHLNHIVSIFGFFHEEYPVRAQNVPDLDELYRVVCGDEGDVGASMSFEGGFDGCGMNLDDDANTKNLLSFRNTLTSLSKKHDLHDTFIAHQQGPNTSYQMQHKPIPFTFSHIDVSTPRTEELKWATLLDKHRSTSEPMFANLFTVGNAVYSMSDKDEADRLMSMNNNNQKIRDLMATHPSHGVFLRDDHREKCERWEIEKRKKNKVKL